jgi:putative ABC transport system substrate-binding protein
MRRRDFITLIGGVTFVSGAVRAQQKLPTIGFLGSNTASATSQWVVAFTQRLHELGWVDGRTVNIEYRWAESRPERFGEIAAEFVRLKVDVIVTHNTPPVLAAKQTTTNIPIVFATAGDPVGSGVVASLARPGGNVTGLSSQGTDTVGKRLELMREITPGFRRVMIMANMLSRYSLLQVAEVQGLASGVGFEAVNLEIRRTEDIAPAISTLRGLTDVLYVTPDPLIFSNRIRINSLALQLRVATVHGLREYLDGGGLMFYGPNWPNQFRRAADFVDKILRGAKPADIPVEQPTKFDLAINLTTAKVLGLTVPPTLLARADEVIE